MCGITTQLVHLFRLFSLDKYAKKTFIDIKFHGSRFKVNQGSLTGTERLKCVDAVEKVPKKSEE